MAHCIPLRDGAQIDPPSYGSWETRADGIYPRDAQTARLAGLSFPAPAPAPAAAPAAVPTPVAPVSVDIAKTK